MTQLDAPGTAAGDALALPLDQATPTPRDDTGGIQIWESERTRPPFADRMRHPFLRLKWARYYEWGSRWRCAGAGAGRGVTAISPGFPWSRLPTAPVRSTKG